MIQSQPGLVASGEPGRGTPSVRSRARRVGADLHEIAASDALDGLRNEVCEVSLVAPVRHGRWRDRNDCRMGRRRPVLGKSLVAGCGPFWRILMRLDGRYTMGAYWRLVNATAPQPTRRPFLNMMGVAFESLTGTNVGAALVL